MIRGPRPRVSVVFREIQNLNGAERRRKSLRGSRAQKRLTAKVAKGKSEGREESPRLSRREQMA